MVKVIFVQNFDHHKVGEIKEIPDGYARNFLFKRGFAKKATEQEVSQTKAIIDKIKKEEEALASKVQKIADKLSSKVVEISEEVNEDGHLYGSVSNKEIAKVLSEMGFEIEPANILAEHIKELGTHTVKVKVGHGVETEITVEVKRK
jgi:large subunit ribosomal protein L9